MGHALMHFWQYPHRLPLNGSSLSSLAVVSMAISLILGPYFGVISRVFFPWFPRPHLTADVFRGMESERRAS